MHNGNKILVITIIRNIRIITQFHKKWLFKHDFPHFFQIDWFCMLGLYHMLSRISIDGARLLGAKLFALLETLGVESLCCLVMDLWMYGCMCVRENLLLICLIYIYIHVSHDVACVY